METEMAQRDQRLTSGLPPPSGPSPHAGAAPLPSLGGVGWGGGGASSSGAGSKRPLPPGGELPSLALGGDGWADSPVDPSMMMGFGSAAPGMMGGAGGGDFGSNGGGAAGGGRSKPVKPSKPSKSKAQKIDAAASAGASKAPQVSRSGRQIKQTRKEGMVDADDDDAAWSETSSTLGYDLDGYGEMVREERCMGLIDRSETWDPDAGSPVIADTISIGMHIAIDLTRATTAHGGRPPPPDDPTQAILTRPSGKGQTNVGCVSKVFPNGECSVRLVCSCAAGSGEVLAEGQAEEVRKGLELETCVRCDAGAIVPKVDAAQRQITCSGCLHVNLPMALPQLFCSGCNRQVKSGTTYYKDKGQRLNIKLCKQCYDGIPRGERPEYLQDVDLEQGTFQTDLWNPKDVQDNDHWVNCEGGCARWFHYICAMYPDPAPLHVSYELEREKFVCVECRHRGASINDSTRLLALQCRRAASLPRHELSDAVEAYVADTAQALGYTCEGLCVRVVTRKAYKFPAVPAMKERYGPDYPDDFPYDSRGVFAFQDIDGRDVCVFAMYVQEYGPSCPQPNTNRTYISYLDSVRYLRTSPPEKRTPVYHSIINGYLKHARDRGFERAHIWVAPPQPGDEYIFHSHPPDARYGNRPMSMNKLREWYVAMLDTAEKAGIVSNSVDIQEHVSHLTSIREFPLFEGDFFPDHLREMLTPPEEKSRGPPGLVRETSSALVKQMMNKTKSMRKRFLVATLTPQQTSNDGASGAASGNGSAGGRRSTRGGGAAAVEATASSAAASSAANAASADDEDEISNDLVDKRADFLRQCQRSHWQYNEIRRAHYSTMMMLAALGGPPNKEDLAAVLRR